MASKSTGNTDHAKPSGHITHGDVFEPCCVRPQQIEVMSFSRRCTGQVVLFLCKAHDRKFGLDTSAFGQSVYQADAAYPLRRPIRAQRLREPDGVAAAHLELRELAYVGDPYCVADRPALGADGIGPARSSKCERRDRIMSALREPVRPFPAVDATEHRPLLCERIVGPCFSFGSPGSPLFIGKVDGELIPERLHRLRNAIVAICKSTESPGIHRQRIHRGLATDDPFGEKLPRTASLHDTHAGSRE